MKNLLIRHYKLVGFFIVIGLGLFLSGAFASASISYERSPAGTEVSSPVIFNVSIDDPADIDCFFDWAYWGISVDKTGGTAYSTLVASTTHSIQYIRDDEVGITYTAVDVGCSPDENYENFVGALTPAHLEFNEGEIIFEIVEAPPSYNIIPMGSGFATSSLAFVGRLFTDLSMVITLLIGLPLAFFVVKGGLDIFRPTF